MKNLRPQPMRGEAYLIPIAGLYIDQFLILSYETELLTKNDQNTICKQIIALNLIHLYYCCSFLS